MIRSSPIITKTIRFLKNPVVIKLIKYIIILLILLISLVTKDFNTIYQTIAPLLLDL